MLDLPGPIQQPAISLPQRSFQDNVPFLRIF
jgi:hypothetical protein